MSDNAIVVDAIAPHPVQMSEFQLPVSDASRPGREVASLKRYPFLMKYFDQALDQSGQTSAQKSRVF